MELPNSVLQDYISDIVILTFVYKKLRIIILQSTCIKLLSFAVLGSMFHKKIALELMLTKISGSFHSFNHSTKHKIIGFNGQNMEDFFLFLQNPEIIQISDEYQFMEKNLCKIDLNGEKYQRLWIKTQSMKTIVCLLTRTETLEEYKYNPTNFQSSSVYKWLKCLSYIGLQMISENQFIINECKARKSITIIQWL
jgi:hypothetical protein